jgi:hypothetical protein
MEVMPDSNSPPAPPTVPLDEPIEASWATAKQSKVPHLDREALKKFVLDFLDGRIFVSAEVREMSLLPNIFMPIAFGALAGFTEEDTKEVGLIWEYLDRAGPRAINGYPIFSSCRIMHRDDWEKAHAAISKEIDRRKAAEASILEDLLCSYKP